MFGSLVAASFVVEAVAEMDDAREGTYDFSGVLDGVSINGAVTLYLAPQQGTSEVSGFMEGTWLSWIAGPAGTTVAAPRIVTGQSVDGRFGGDTLHLTIPAFLAREGPDVLVDLFLRGIRSPNGPFAVQVAESTVAGRFVLGDVTVTKR